MVKKGDVYYADFTQGVGSEQLGRRPIVVIQNDDINLCSPTTIVAMITSKNKKDMPTHVTIGKNCYGLSTESVVMLEQIKTIDKQRLGIKIGHISEKTMRKIDDAAKYCLDITK